MVTWKKAVIVIGVGYLIGSMIHASYSIKKPEPEPTPTPAVVDVGNSPELKAAHEEIAQLKEQLANVTTEASSWKAKSLTAEKQARERTPAPVVASQPASQPTVYYRRGLFGRR